MNVAGCPRRISVGVSRACRIPFMNPRPVVGVTNFGIDEWCQTSRMIHACVLVGESVGIWT